MDPEFLEKIADAIRREYWRKSDLPPFDHESLRDRLHWRACAIAAIDVYTREQLTIDMLYRMLVDKGMPDVDICFGSESGRAILTIVDGPMVAIVEGDSLSSAVAKAMYQFGRKSS